MIRSLRPGDRDAVLDLHENVSDDTLRLRFFTANRNAGPQYVAHLFDPSTGQRSHWWAWSAVGWRGSQRAK